MANTEGSAFGKMLQISHIMSHLWYPGAISHDTCDIVCHTCVQRYLENFSRPALCSPISGNVLKNRSTEATSPARTAESNRLWIMLRSLDCASWSSLNDMSSVLPATHITHSSHWTQITQLYVSAQDMGLITIIHQNLGTPSYCLNRNDVQSTTSNRIQCIVYSMQSVLNVLHNTSLLFFNPW